MLQHARKAESFWLCTTRPFDLEQLSRAGIPFEALESPRWRGGRGFLGPMARALTAAVRRIREFRPHVAVGLGGYGMVPPILAAAALGVPYVLLEPNVRPGRANRWLAPGAARIYLQWPQARSGFPGAGARLRVTGSPLRARLRRIPRPEALRRFGLEEGHPTLAVVGGSQGAEILNRGVLTALDGLAKRLQIIHMAGPSQVEQVREAYRRREVRAVVCGFVPDVEFLYSAADLVVCRAGAMTIAELAALRVPAVLVPIARSAGDHQRENARAVARIGAGILMEESDCLAGKLAGILRRLAQGDPTFDRMRDRLGVLARPEASEEILRDLETVARR